MLGKQRANNFRGKQLRAAAPWPILCVFCAFVSCTCGPLRGGGRGTSAVHYASCIFYVCVCAREEKGKAALAAAICSPVTKILCPKTLSSVNIYGAIAVQSPSPLSPSLAVVFPCVDTRQRKLSTKFVPRAAWHAATIDNNNKSNKRKII